jgi:hypothetical protein
MPAPLRYLDYSRVAGIPSTWLHILLLMLLGEVGAEGIGRPTPAKWPGWSSPYCVSDAPRSQPSHSGAVVPTLAHLLSSCFSKLCAVSEIPALPFGLGFPL